MPPLDVDVVSTFMMLRLLLRAELRASGARVAADDIR